MPRGPVDEEGLPTIDYLNTLNTKAKWERFWKVANERSQLQLWHPSVCQIADLQEGAPVHCAMDGEAKIVEVSFFGGKILVTFADGMMALLEPGQIRQLAVETNALTPLPTDDIPS